MSTTLIRNSPALQHTKSNDSIVKGATGKQRCVRFDTMPQFPGLQSVQHEGSDHGATDYHEMSIGEMNNPRFEPGAIYSLIPGRLSFSAHDNDDHTLEEIRSNPQLFFFSTDLQERYLPFCADFGPVNLGAVVHFCDYVRDKEADSRLKGRHLVYYCTNDVESLSNTAFLLAAYVMLEHGLSPEQAIEPFNVSGIPIMPFRDPTFVASTFPLTVLDCLRGLKKAVDLKWFDLNEFNLDEYELFDSPEYGDMHQICPKFVAFRGPEQRRKQRKDTRGTPPELVIKMLKLLRVTKVIRLNEPDAYNRKVFVDAGMEHVDLHFADCTCPSDEHVVQFLEACEQEKGVVGVHCLAGLGRTGTMIGVWLMSKHGFTAREAIAWMRIVRPGSVIGPQQHYLEWMEGRLERGSFPLTRAHLASSPLSFSAPAAALSHLLADQVRRAIAHHR